MGQFFYSLMLFFSVLVLTGCEIAGDIFKTGVWVGVLLVFGIIALVVWMISHARG